MPLRQYRRAVTPAPVNTFLLLAAGEPHQTALIAQVVLQGCVDSVLEEGSRGAASRLEAGGGADQLIAGHLAGIIKLDQHREALLERAGQDIGQGEGLWIYRIAAAVEAGRSRAERRNANAMTGAAEGVKPLRVEYTGDTSREGRCSCPKGKEADLHSP